MQIFSETPFSTSVSKQSDSHEVSESIAFRRDSEKLSNATSLIGETSTLAKTEAIENIPPKIQKGWHLDWGRKKSEKNTEWCDGHRIREAVAKFQVNLI